MRAARNIRQIMACVPVNIATIPYLVVNVMTLTPSNGSHIVLYTAMLHSRSFLFDCLHLLSSIWQVMISEVHTCHLSIAMSGR